MATLRKKRKLAAVTREIQEENPRNGQSRNTSVPRINEEYITKVSEQIEGRVTKKLSQEFSQTESRILGALSKLDEFLSNQQIQTHSKTVPGTFRNTNVENQGTNEDDSQSDPHPEAGIFCGQTTQKSGPKDCRDSYNIHAFMHLCLVQLRLFMWWRKNVLVKYFTDFVKKNAIRGRTNNKREAGQSYKLCRYYKLSETPSKIF